MFAIRTVIAIMMHATSSLLKFFARSNLCRDIKCINYNEDNWNMTDALMMLQPETNLVDKFLSIYTRFSLKHLFKYHLPFIYKAKLEYLIWPHCIDSKDAKIYKKQKWRNEEYKKALCIHYNWRNTMNELSDLVKLDKYYCFSLLNHRKHEHIRVSFLQCVWFVFSFVIPLQ